MSQLLQKTVVLLRNNLLPRGWAPFLSFLTRLNPSLKCYRAIMKDGDELYLDLSAKMCAGYFFMGELPHEKNSKKIFQRSLSPGGTFVDVGANIGFYTRMGRKIVGEKGKVVSFEPLPEAFKLLKKNVEDFDNVVINKLAVGSKTERSVFFIHPSGDQSSVLPVEGNIREIEVSVVRLDEILARENRIDLIKIDVEGNEMEVLKGAEKTINMFHPVVHFEYLDKFSEVSGFSVEDYVSYFNSFDGANYNLYFVGLDRKVLVPLSEAGNDIVAIPSEKTENIDL